MSDINAYTTILKTQKTVFSIDELAQIWSSLSRKVLSDKLNYLVKTKKLVRIKRGLYAINGREINNLELGNKIKSPSYISFYTVLAKEGIIFQYYDSIYLASDNSTEIEVNEKRFIYKKLKDEILFNPNGIETINNYQIASKERAYLDTLYLNPGKGFDNEAKLDKEICFDLVPLYQNERLLNEVKKRLA